MRNSIRRRYRSGQFFAFLIFLAFILFLGFYLGKGSLPQSPISQTPPPQVKETIPTKEEFSLVFAQIEGGKTSLYLLNTSVGEKKLIFTDADRIDKIKQTRGIGSSGQILVFTGKEEFSGSLHLLTLQGKLEKIIEEFSSPQPPVLSPDGEKIAFILFSNAEPDFGFSLNIMDKAGGNKKRLAKSLTGIFYPTWNQESNKLAFLETSAQDTKLKVIDLESGKVKDFFSFQNQQFFGLDWKGERFILAYGPLQDLKDSQIYLLQGGFIKKLTQDKTIKLSPVADEGGEKIAYLEKTSLKEKQGQLKVTNLAGDISSFGPADYIIGGEK